MTKTKTITDEQFIQAIKSSFSVREAVSKLDLAHAGGSYKFFWKRAKELNADTSHFRGKGWLKGRKHNFSKKIPLSEILIENSLYTSTNHLKKRLIKEGILINKCSKCQLTGIWNGEPIVLQMDHINGVCDDHRIENLRLLCPNCHSQTSTYCSSKRGESKIRKDKKPDLRRSSPIIYLCESCNQPRKSKRHKYCLDCYRLKRAKLQTKYNREKINWPSVEQLQQELQTKSYCQLGRELGVSDNAIRKYIKRNS